MTPVLTSMVVLFCGVLLIILLHIVVSRIANRRFQRKAARIWKDRTSSGWINARAPRSQSAFDAGDRQFTYVVPRPAGARGNSSDPVMIEKITAGRWTGLATLVFIVLPILGVILLVLTWVLR